ncbi:hypothetical protein CBR_g131 [Chara braunii]|uniref:RING-type domain-containing protein n=1 Tax=Chara braunii TaxID=69332 RepID=A0A388JLT9_CHABU|nr:hypothetical protein CBR_g131 [Chara braunii]|eukprot:GBG58731.1 hypothetical protein CBR_g131 [Chara braunii]
MAAVRQAEVHAGFPPLPHATRGKVFEEVDGEGQFSWKATKTEDGCAIVAGKGKREGIDARGAGPKIGLGFIDKLDVKLEIGRLPLAPIGLSSIVAAGVQVGLALQLALLTPLIQSSLIGVPASDKTSIEAEDGVVVNDVVEDPRCLDGLIPRNTGKGILEAEADEEEGCTALPFDAPANNNGTAFAVTLQPDLTSGQAPEIKEQLSYSKQGGDMDGSAGAAVWDGPSAAGTTGTVVSGGTAHSPLSRKEEQRNEESGVMPWGFANGDDPSVCSICLEEIRLEEVAQIKGCEHVYCAQCILRWATYKDDPWCPQCRNHFHSLYTFRDLRGSLRDSMVEESVCLLLRAKWFKHEVVRQEAEETDLREFQYSYQDEVLEDDGYGYDDYYVPAVRLGNRRWGGTGYVRSGRKEARVVNSTSSPGADGAASSSGGTGKGKGKGGEPLGRRAKRQQKREAMDKAAAEKLLQQPQQRQAQKRSAIHRSSCLTDTASGALK